MEQCWWEIGCVHGDLKASAQLQWTVSSNLSQLINQSQRLFWLFPQSLKPLNKLSNLCQHDLVGVCVALDAEDEGVFVGVVLNDVIIHVHQDSAAKHKSFISRAEHESSKLAPTLFSRSVFVSLTLSYFSCTLWLSSLWAHHISLISTNKKKGEKKQLMNRHSAANKLCLWH